MNIKDQIRAEIERQRQFIEGIFTEGDNSFYDGLDDAYNHILAFLDTLPEQPVEGLEEAAEKHIEDIWGGVGHPGWDWGTRDVFDAFIAGAEWGMNQCPLPEDTTIFMKGVAEGRRLEKDDNISLIESRIAEILGDAQPAPILRTELMELIEKIKK